jgi:hypothetical protein
VALGEEDGGTGTPSSSRFFDCLEIVHEQLQPILRTSKFVDGELPAISAYSRSFCRRERVGGSAMER